MSTCGLRGTGAFVLGSSAISAPASFVTWSQVVARRFCSRVGCRSPVDSNILRRAGF
jgi:hypothetical protein